ncbi:MAG: helix-turn-helix transcriptional regulator [Agathobacter sp.]|nr:helix-turn-helix transcriptional regulator [Agathobacter sp.]
MNIGNKISAARRELGITQVELADKMSVTRQTVSRWESGTALPDIEKVSQLASLLMVSCDYLLGEEDISSNVDNNDQPSSRLLANLTGKKVKIYFYEDEEDYDLLDKLCIIESFEGNWVKVTLEGKKKICKLIALSSILSIEIKNEGGIS